MNTKTNRIAGWLLMLLALISVPIYAQGAIAYVYDELGCLVGAIDSAGDSVTYAYDAVGNVVPISRQSSAQISIIEFTPNSGTVGTAVSTSPTPVSGVAADNIAGFNSAAATITSAATTHSS